jgi:hypothetical protein
MSGDFRREQGFPPLWVAGNRGCRRGSPGASCGISAGWGVVLKANGPAANSLAVERCRRQSRTMSSGRTGTRVSVGRLRCGALRRSPWWRRPSAPRRRPDSGVHPPRPAGQDGGCAIGAGSTAFLQIASPPQRGALVSRAAATNRNGWRTPQPRRRVSSVARSGEVASFAGRRGSPLRTARRGDQPLGSMRQTFEASYESTQSEPSPKRRFCGRSGSL